MLVRLFSQEALLFTIPAILGTVVFLLRLGLMAIGGHAGDVHADAPVVDVQADVDPGHAGAGDSTEAFKLLSVQSVAAFLMGFGWGGAGSLIGFDWQLPASLLVGAGLGAAFVWLQGLLMKATYDLQASGNIRIEDAVGSEASVYAGIPARGSGRGQVRVVVGDRARIYNAVTEGEPIATGTRVRILRANHDHTLTVVPV